MLKIERQILGVLETCCYIVQTDSTRSAFIIDPADECAELENACRNYTIESIIVTHGHGDHIAGIKQVKKLSQALLYVHEDDAPMLTDPSRNLSRFVMTPFVSPPADGLFKGEQCQFLFRNISFQVLHTPGHTAGSISLYQPEEKILFSGDFIFDQSIGRMDFPGSDPKKMKASLLKILDFPDDIRVYPGHGEDFILGDFKPAGRYFIERYL